MTLALILVFIITYAAIALEEVIKINKSASALIGAGVLWCIYALSSHQAEVIDNQLAHSLIETAQIAFFLLGAMTIVEVIDAHNGFEVITSRIKAKSLSALVFSVAIITFFLSAILDNLTTTIVMVSLVRKLLSEREKRLLFAGLIVICANAGGAWSPIGDVTTTMLWIGGQISSLAVIKGVLLPSIVCAIIPTLFIAYKLRGQAIEGPSPDKSDGANTSTRFERNLMFGLGLAALIFVPIFKAITHLPPYLGILFGLGILWAVGDLVHKNKDEYTRRKITIAHALTRIDMSVIVFFIGILLAVATLSHTKILADMAQYLDKTIGNQAIIVMVFGLFSAIIDNVPMVAAAMGMYSLETYPQDSFLWEFMAYAAGTGGSALIIGSAAGVAAMGLEKIEFGWYIKKFTLIALIGYFAGCGVYILQYSLGH